MAPPARTKRLTQAARGKYDAERAAAILQVTMCCDEYERQMKRGKLFLHECPCTASSWKLERVQRLL